MGVLSQRHNSSQSKSTYIVILTRSSTTCIRRFNVQIWLSYTVPRFLISILPSVDKSFPQKKIHWQINLACGTFLWLITTSLVIVFIITQSQPKPMLCIIPCQSHGRCTTQFLHVKHKLFQKTRFVSHVINTIIPVTWLHPQLYSKINSSHLRLFGIFITILLFTKDLEKHVTDLTNHRGKISQI